MIKRELLRKCLCVYVVVITYTGLLSSAGKRNDVFSNGLTNQMPGLQIVTPQSAEVFRDDKVDLPALNGSQHSL